MIHQQLSDTLASLLTGLSNWPPVPGSLGNEPMGARQDQALQASAPIHSDGPLPLAAALDAQMMTVHLRAKLTDMAHLRQFTVADCQLLDCKPTKRALICYTVVVPGYAPGYTTGNTTVQRIFGKIYSDADQLNRVDLVTSALWNALFCPGATGHGDDLCCTIPQPLGIIPELNMHLYRPVDGEFLDAVLHRPSGSQAMTLTAHWLSALHHHPLRIAKRFDLANELRNLAKWTEVVAQQAPTAAAAAEQLLTKIQRRAKAIVLETETAIHKDFHYRHVLYQPNAHRQRAGAISVIDFDEMRLGDRNFDLAHFSANLHLLAYRQHGDPHWFRTNEQRFLRTYAQNNRQTWAAFTHEHRQRFHFFYGYSCIKIARQLTLGFGPSPVPVNEERIRQIQMILEQGNQQ